MQAETEKRPPAIIVFLNIANTITHLVLGAVAISAFMFAIRLPSSDFAQHIYLCVTGYVILMAQAVLTFSPYTGWSMSLRHQDKKTIHWLMQIAGAILAIAGSIVRITNVNTHFRSAHGIFGIIAMVLTIISLFGGVANLYLNKTVFTKIAHSCFGSLTIVAAFICLCLGFDTWIYRWVMSEEVAALAIVLTVIGLLGVLISAVITNIKNLTTL